MGKRMWLAGKWQAGNSIEAFFLLDGISMSRFTEHALMENVFLRMKNVYGYGQFTAMFLKTMMWSIYKKHLIVRLMSQRTSVI